MEDLPAEFWQGVKEFNSGEFYACHDTLEAIWMEAMNPDKTFIQGILQLAVALYHLSNQNWKGAVILLGEGTRRLTAYEPDYSGVNVTQLLDESLALLEMLHQAGAEQVEDLSAQLSCSVEQQTPNPDYPDTPYRLCRPIIQQTSDLQSI